jgi:ATP-binding protein involved in chromosome partitioning
VARASVEVTQRIAAHAVQRGVKLLPEVRNIIAVASGKGGVGKSTVAANLALALARSGAKTGLLDADIYGPSVPTLIGIHETPAMIEREGRNIMVPNEKHGIKLLSIGFMAAPDQAIVWRGPMISSAFRQFVNDVEWGELDYLFIDMPPGTGDVQMGLARMLPRTDLLIVTTPALAAQKVAARAADMARRSFLRVCGVIENMSAFTCEHGESYALFGEGGGQALADEVGVALLGRIPIEPTVAAGGDAGRPVALDGTGPAADEFRRIARLIIDEVAPPTNMAGCSARMLDLVAAALDARDKG